MIVAKLTDIKSLQRPTYKMDTSQTQFFFGGGICDAEMAEIKLGTLTIV